MSTSRPRRPRTSFFLPPPLIFRPPLGFSFSRIRPLHVRPVPCACLRSTDPPAQYVPLHVHSDFSLLDGASQLPSLVRRAAELGVPALALTDHGVLYGAIQLVKTCASTGVKPIVGNEMYIVDDGFEGDDDDAKAVGSKRKRYHLIVLAKNTTGYRNLVKLTTIAHLHGKVGKGIFARPCINKALLYQYREGLMVSSACLGGEIAQAILNDDVDSARNVARWYHDIFGDDYYLEIQDHGSEEDKKVNPVMVQLGRELAIKVIATNDSHFTSCLDAEAHDALICIQTGKLLTDQNRLHYAGNEYFKSVDEMRQCFVDHLERDDIDQALWNTVEVADKVEQYDLFGATRIPDFPVPAKFGHSHDAYLRDIAWNSLHRRLYDRQAAGLADSSLEEHYFERLEMELKMIADMGFSSYFLVVWDYIKYAREQGIPVGPGRGSAAGSLVAFALRITDVDPIPFNLLFERFLNPERKSMPDIDTDFSVNGRDKVIAYVNKRYGIDRVAQIITFNRLTSKAVLKDVARVHNVPYSEADRLAKLIPVFRGKPATLTKMLSANSPSRDFKAAIEQNPSYGEWIEKAQRIEGTNKTFGIHAAGVVISSSPLTEIVPLSKAKHGEVITQYAMEDVESLGLLKMDFLGLKNLTVIETALDFINEGRRKMGIEEDLNFSVDALPLNDPKTYHLLAEGELDGIFQLDASAGMRNIVRELRPSNLEDISSILALYRPGPLDAGLIPKFIRRKHGIDPIEYDHPLLEPILKETYGIMVYQEQIMRIARDLAGYSLGQADILRRAMGKKKLSIMEKERPRFVAGAEERGVSKEKAEELFEMMLKFAEYCFNKSHSTAYAYLTYQTAYLKANYPVEYSAALLRSNMNQSDKLIRYLADANISGVRVAPPSVNKSQLGFTVDRSGDGGASVLFGLEAVKAVGESVSRALLEERNARGPFRNIIDLIERVNLRVLNKRAMGALIQAGSFDELHPNRKVLLNHLDSLLALRRKLRDKKKRRERKDISEEEERIAVEEDALEWEEVEMLLARDSETLPDFTSLELFAAEKATLGFYASGHPLLEFRHVGQRLGCTHVGHIIADLSDDGQAQEEISHGFGTTLPDGMELMILSCVTDLKRVTTAKGKKMGKWMIEDSTGRVPGVVFPNSYDVMEQLVIENLRAEAQMNSPTFDAPLGTTLETSKTSSHIVEEDARVIVWGKVDKESSGTVQIMIDDVQRVEDVSVIMVTALYNSDREPATHLHILRHMAARILEVDLSEPGFKSYVDANGEKRKRRYTKSIPLSKKNRIPVILQCLGEDGRVTASLYAGNNLRFPTDCLDLLKPLAENTGFHVELLSIADDILVAKDDKEPVRKNVLGRTNDSSDKARKVYDSKDTHWGAKEHLAVKNEVTAPAPIAMSTRVIAKASKKSETRKDSHELVRQLPAETERNKSKYEEDADIMVGDVRLTTAQYEQYKLYNASIKALMEQRKSDSTSPELQISRQDHSLYWSTSVGRRTAKSGSQLVSKIIWPVRSRVRMAESGAIAANVATVTRTDSISSTMASYDSQFSRSSTSVRSAESNSMVIPGERSTGIRNRPVEQRQIEDQSQNVFDNCSYSINSKDNADTKLKPSTETWVERNNHDEVRTLPLRERDDSTDECEREPDDRAPSFGRERYFDATESWVDKLEIEFDHSGLAGVLDAVTFVAGRVSGQNRPDVVILGTSGLDLSRLVEDNVRLLISGRIAYTYENLIYALVDVKETFPSGKRRRVRSFGPVICVLKVSRTPETISVKTKKAMREVETVRQRLEKAGSEVAVDVNTDDQLNMMRRRRKRVARSSEADFTVSSGLEDAGVCSNLNDGGQLLFAMTRAARLCLDRGLGLALGSTVVTLDGFYVNNPDALTSLTAITINVHLEGLCFGTGKTQVEAIGTTADGSGVSCRASFRVSAAKQMGQSSLSVLADKETLFTGSDSAAFFRDVAANLPR